LHPSTSVYTEEIPMNTIRMFAIAAALLMTALLFGVFAEAFS
jgi:hypothetical protein